MKSKILLSGPFLVAFAALLWSTEALVRYPTANSSDPMLMVLVEHIIALAFLFPYVLWRQRSKLFCFTAREWLAAVFVGAFGSALAMLCFTISFRYVNPSVAILIQKFQPVFVVLIAFLVLGERSERKFYYWALLAFLATLVLSFPDLDFKSALNTGDLHTFGILYAGAASALWAASTVFGKFLLSSTPVSVTAFWRFFFGCVTLFLIGSHQSLESLLSVAYNANLWSILYLAIFPGLLGMVVYYAGLNRTLASVTTFIEIIYPVLAVLLNTLFLKTPLNLVQIVSGSVLIFAVMKISTNDIKQGEV